MCTSTGIIKFINTQIFRKQFRYNIDNFIFYNHENNLKSSVFNYLNLKNNKKVFLGFNFCCCVDFIFLFFFYFLSFLFFRNKNFFHEIYFSVKKFFLSRVSYKKINFKILKNNFDKNICDEIFLFGNYFLFL